MGKGGRPLSELSIRMLREVLRQPLSSTDLALKFNAPAPLVKMCLERLRRDKSFIAVVKEVRSDHCKKPVRLYATTTAGLQYLQSLDEAKP